MTIGIETGQTIYLVGLVTHKDHRGRTRHLRWLHIYDDKALAEAACRTTLHFVQPVPLALLLSGGKTTAPYFPKGPAPRTKA